MSTTTISFDAATEEGKATRQSRTIYGPPLREEQASSAPVPSTDGGSAVS